MDNIIFISSGCCYTGININSYESEITAKREKVKLLKKKKTK